MAGPETETDRIVFKRAYECCEDQSANCAHSLVCACQPFSNPSIIQAAWTLVPGHPNNSGSASDGERWSCQEKAPPGGWPAARTHSLPGAGFWISIHSADCPPCSGKLYHVHSTTWRCVTGGGISEQRRLHYVLAKTSVPGTLQMSPSWSCRIAFKKLTPRLSSCQVVPIQCILRARQLCRLDFLNGQRRRPSLCWESAMVSSACQLHTMLSVAASFLKLAVSFMMYVMEYVPSLRFRQRHIRT